MKINTNEEEFFSSLNVSGIFNFEKEAPISNWLDTNLESIRCATINLPVDWLQVLELNKNVKWPLFTSIATDRIEKERLSIQSKRFNSGNKKNSRKCSMKSWINRHSINSVMKKKKVRVLHICYLKCSKSEEPFPF